MAKESKCIVSAGHHGFPEETNGLSLRLVGISGVVSHLHELRD